MDSLTTFGSALLLEARLCNKDNSLSAQVLVNAGVEQSLLDAELARQLGVELELLPPPVPVTALNGKLISTMQYRSAPVQLVLSGNHH